MKNKINSSLRTNRRYLLIESDSKKDIEDALKEYLGVLGIAKSKLEFIEGEKYIISIDRKMVDWVRASFEMSDKKIKIKKVSGTLKGLKNEK